MLIKPNVKPLTAVQEVPIVSLVTVIGCETIPELQKQVMYVQFDVSNMFSFSVPYGAGGTVINT